MELIKGYMNDSHQRHQLNVLTQKTFGFDFESWVTGGYFEGDYIPYSLIENEEMVSNASVNLMNFMQNGTEKHYIQIGTVMTAEEHRKKGYAKKLIERILSDYQEQCDGIYLFGNLSAVGFYQKLGFQQAMQYQYSLNADQYNPKEVSKWGSPSSFQKLCANDPAHKNRYMNAVRHSAVNCALEQTNKFGLQMFYTANLENVYYNRALDCYAVYEINDGTLSLQSVISTRPIGLQNVLTSLLSAHPVKKLVLGFAPCSEAAMLFQARPYDGGEDYRLFYIGEQIQAVEKERLYFPELSHA